MYAIIATDTVAAADGSEDIITLVSASEENQGRTLTRIVGDLIFVPPNSAGEYGVMVGVCVVEEDARVGAAVPDPESDTFAWLYLKRFHIHVPNVDGLGAPSRVYPYTLDLRTMRKLNSRTAVVMVIETIIAMPSSLAYKLQTRSLLLLA